MTKQGSPRLVYCPTDDIVADALTKALPSAKVKHFTTGLGLLGRAGEIRRCVGGEPGMDRTTISQHLTIIYLHRCPTDNNRARYSNSLGYPHNRLYPSLLLVSHVEPC